MTIKKCILNFNNKQKENESSIWFSDYDVYLQNFVLATPDKPPVFSNKTITN